MSRITTLLNASAMIVRINVTSPETKGKLWRQTNATQSTAAIRIVARVPRTSRTVLASGRSPPLEREGENERVRLSAIDKARGTRTSIMPSQNKARKSPHQSSHRTTAPEMPMARETRPCKDPTSLERSRQIIAIAITTSGMDNPIARADRTPASTASRSHMAENAIVAASIATNIRIREWERADTTDAASAMRKSAVASLEVINATSE